MTIEAAVPVLRGSIKTLRDMRRALKNEPALSEVVIISHPNGDDTTETIHMFDARMRLVITQLECSLDTLLRLRSASRTTDSGPVEFTCGAGRDVAHITKEEKL